MIFQADAYVSAFGFPGLQPAIGQEFIDLACGMGVYPPQDVVEVGVGIKIDPAATHHDAEEDRGVAAAFFAAHKQPVLSPGGHGFEGLLAQAVADRQVAIAGILVCCPSHPKILQDLSNLILQKTMPLLLPKFRRPP